VRERAKTAPRVGIVTTLVFFEKKEGIGKKATRWGKALKPAGGRRKSHAYPTFSHPTTPQPARLSRLAYEENEDHQGHREGHRPEQRVEKRQDDAKDPDAREILAINEHGGSSGLSQRNLASGGGERTSLFRLGGSG
jgi:hypothetical protein